MGFVACLFMLFFGFVVFAIVGTVSLPLLALLGGLTLAIGVLWAVVSLLGLLVRVVFGVVFGIGGLVLGALGLVVVLPLLVLLPLALPLLVLFGIIALVRWAQRPSAPLAPHTLPHASA